ncbi:alcohol dehydrogenase catalytic domain-containing protein [Curtobacterium sp. YR515]|uniref:alcohol dehydrogenase catalytic domain-containing protein n=1 Tax=Curtobacterium sp. YR515 TaxID=1855316 RepID=UPI0026769010|nr:alcohol dehydrogenase catalytic domain-containing protein [Curtobacterium sp. YR515]
MRIRVQAFAVNSTDTGVRAGQRDSSQASPPYVPGMDAAGVIDEVGPDVSGWEVGDEVMAIALPLSAHGGAYVEELVAPVGSFTRIPWKTWIPLASTMPMNGLTALQILSRAGLAPGQTLAVTGAAGLLGNYVVQLAVAGSGGAACLAAGRRMSGSRRVARWGGSWCRGEATTT